MTFPTGVDFMKYSDEELTTMLAEAGEASKHARKRGRVMGIVAAHRLKQMRELLMYEELATWRRENGFDRVEAVEKNWFGDHRLLSPTPEQYYAGLWFEANALRDAISIPAKSRPRQKDSMDELLAKFEYAEIKRCIDKRCREEAQAQAQMTAKPVGAVQHCSPSSPNPDTPPNVCFNLENEGMMSQELEELTSSSVGTGLETPGQQGPPNEGTLEQRQTTASGILTAGVDSRKKGNISSPMESVDTRASEKSTRTVTVADIPSIAATPSKRKHKTSSEENKQFDPGGTGEKALPWNAAAPLPLFSCGEAGRLFVCLSVAKLGGFLPVFSALCVFSRTYIFPFTGESYQQDVFSRRGQVMYATGGQAFSRLPPYLKMTRTSNAWFGRSANTLG